MDYAVIVDAIKRVTGLDAPVYYNDMEASFQGSPYFGIGNHIMDIVPEEVLNDPFYDPIDFIENSHIGYFHIGLPEKIFRKKNDFVYRVVGELLKENGINTKLDEALLEVFVILHEFGHAHQVLVSYEGNIERYIIDTHKESDFNSYLIRTSGLGGTEEGLRLHKSTLTEKYADAFAVQYFNAVVGEIRQGAA